MNKWDFTDKIVVATKGTFLSANGKTDATISINNSVLSSADKESFFSAAGKTELLLI